MPDELPATDGPNAAMADNWNGVGGRHWVTHEARHDRALAAYGRDVLQAAALAATDRVLDVGCGTGAMTRAAARVATRGTALGVDIGRPLVEAARARAAEEGPANVTFEQADAQVHPFAPGSLDVVISRFGVMFFDDGAAAFGNVRRALVDGGRLAFVCWQGLAANDWMLVPAGALARHVGMPDVGGPDAPGPFSLSDPQRVRVVLGAGGFSSVTVDEVAHPMWLGSDVDDAVGYMRNQSVARTLLADKPPELVDRALADLRATLTDVVGPDGIELAGRAWLVTARAA
jgi:SAM-dependent methyltransferase